jgi:hypothetical protein
MGEEMREQPSGTRRQRQEGRPHIGKSSRARVLAQVDLDAPLVIKTGQASRNKKDSADVPYVECCVLGRATTDQAKEPELWIPVPAGVLVFQDERENSVAAAQALLEAREEAPKATEQLKADLASFEAARGRLVSSKRSTVAVDNEIEAIDAEMAQAKKAAEQRIDAAREELIKAWGRTATIFFYQGSTYGSYRVVLADTTYASANRDLRVGVVRLPDRADGDKPLVRTGLVVASSGPVTEIDSQASSKGFLRVTANPAERQLIILTVCGSRLQVRQPFFYSEGFAAESGDIIVEGSGGLICRVYVKMPVDESALANGSAMGEAFVGGKHQKARVVPAEQESGKAEKPAEVTEEKETRRIGTG